VFSELTSKANRERVLLVMIPLLVLQLVLLSVQIQNPSGTLLFKTWALSAQAPFITVSSGATNGIRNVWHRYVWMVGARAENEQLRDTVSRLLLQNRAYAEVEQENIRLRRLLALDDSNSFQTLGAHVVARTPGFLSGVIYINRGSADGIHVNAPVVSGDGIIGRTTLVLRHQSQVQLITNSGASIGALLERTRTPGVLRGSGESKLDLIYISNTVEINIGDTVLSSGLDGIYPKGLVIGKVVDLHEGDSVFQAIKVMPDVDLIRLEEVSVLLGRPELEDELVH
jgi:rod shape-determining protein MreC